MTTTAEAIELCDDLGMTVALPEYTAAGTWNIMLDGADGTQTRVGELGAITRDELRATCLSVIGDGDPADVVVYFEPEAAGPSWSDSFYRDEPQGHDDRPQSTTVTVTIPASAVAVVAMAVVAVVSIIARRRRRR